MSDPTARARQATATRELILSAAERLFAEHGLSVSNRQISEAARQGNNTAVGYHFGTKADLVRAIIRKHSEQIDRLRTRMVAEIADPTSTREWVACVVRPTTQHLDNLGTPTWFARFAAQVLTDPAFRGIMVAETLDSPSLVEALAMLNQCLPDLSAQARAERGDMVRQLLVHMVAERERALAEGTPTPRPDWQSAATGLIDAIVAVWHAPGTSPPDDGE